MSTALVPIETDKPALEVVEKAKAAIVYAPGVMTALLSRLKKEVREQASKLDVSVKKDRAEIISLSARVRSAKVRLDELGAELTEEHRIVVNGVNKDRKLMREDLIDFAGEIRKPVTDIETKEKEREAAHEEALLQFDALIAFPVGQTTPALVKQRIAEIETLHSRDWEEFSVRAAGVYAVTMQSAQKMLEAVEQAEAERAELERLRAEAAERAIKEREEAAARAATEAAERKAKEQAEAAQRAAEAEQQRIENERLQAEARAKQAEEKAKRDAEEAEKRLIAEKQAAARRAEEAAAQAKRDQERAIESERQRVADEARRIKEADDARERNQSHRRKVNREALDGLSTVGIPEALGKALIEAIIKGNIPHVTITY